MTIENIRLDLLEKGSSHKVTDLIRLFYQSEAITLLTGTDTNTFYCHNENGTFKRYMI